MLKRVTGVAASPGDIVRNQVLSTLSDEQFARLRPFLSRVELRKGSVICDANKPVDAVYFIESGILSRVARTQADGAVETAIVGRHGFVGIAVVLGASHALNRTVVQVAGEALRIASDDLRPIMDADSAIRDHFLRYVQILISLKGQIALCNAKHGIEKRVARWLLLAHDRIGKDELPVTHDFLASMLGVRRPGVSDALSELEKAGIIAKSRASLSIIQRDGLKARACECYSTIEQKFATMRNLRQFRHRLDDPIE